MAIQSSYSNNTVATALASEETLNVHWRAVFAGVFIATLVYITLMTLGLAIGATGLERVIREGGQFSSVGKGAGIWTILSVLVSLFVGSYAAGRVSGIVATRVGYTQGAVISALFFSIMLSQIGMGLGMLGMGLSGLTSSIGSGVTALAQNPRIVQIAEDNLGDLSFRSSASEVMTGVLTRMETENTESAVNYLAVQAGISPEDAQARLSALSDKVEARLQEAGRQAANTAQWLGWSAFAILLLGSVSALVGGGIGAQVNMRKPLGEMDRRVLSGAPLAVHT